MSLPRFTEGQQQFVVDNLIAMTPHREIAQAFRNLYPEFAPEVEDSVYTEAFIKRAADYVSNKDRKWAKLIVEGREVGTDSVDHLLLTHKRFRIQLRESVLDSLWKIESDLESSKIELDVAKFLRSTALDKLKVIDGYEKSEREEMKLSSRSFDDDGDWGFLTEDAFNYGQEASTPDTKES